MYSTLCAECSVKQSKESSYQNSNPSKLFGTNSKPSVTTTDMQPKKIVKSLSDQFSDGRQDFISNENLNFESTNNNLFDKCFSDRKINKSKVLVPETQNISITRSPLKPVNIIPDSMPIESNARSGFDDSNDMFINHKINYNYGISPAKSPRKNVVSPKSKSPVINCKNSRDSPYRRANLAKKLLKINSECCIINSSQEAESNENSSQESCASVIMDSPSPSLIRTKKRNDQHYNKPSSLSDASPQKNKLGKSPSISDLVSEDDFMPKQLSSENFVQVVKVIKSPDNLITKTDASTSNANKKLQRRSADTMSEIHTGNAIMDESLNEDYISSLEPGYYESNDDTDANKKIQNYFSKPSKKLQRRSADKISEIHTGNAIMDENLNDNHISSLEPDYSESNDDDPKSTSSVESQSLFSRPNEKKYIPVTGSKLYSKIEYDPLSCKSKVKSKQTTLTQASFFNTGRKGNVLGEIILLMPLCMAYLT